jgi:hypothetical protein
MSEIHDLLEIIGDGNVEIVRLRKELAANAAETASLRAQVERLTQLLREVHGVMKSSDFTWDEYMDLQKRVEAAALEPTEERCANCHANDWVTAGFPVSREYCKNCGAARAALDTPT